MFNFLQHLFGIAPPDAPHPVGGWIWLAVWQNAFMWFLDIFLVVIFSAYARKRIAEDRHARPTSVAEAAAGAPPVAPEQGLMEALHQRSPSTDGAIALAGYFGGMVLVRGALWMVRYGFISTNLSAIMVSLGLAVSMWALLCLLRIFARGPWGPRAWLICLGVSLLLAFALT